MWVWCCSSLGKTSQVDDSVRTYGFVALVVPGSLKPSQQQPNIHTYCPGRLGFVQAMWLPGLILSLEVVPRGSWSNYEQQWLMFCSVQMARRPPPSPPAPAIRVAFMCLGHASLLFACIRGTKWPYSIHSMSAFSPEWAGVWSICTIFIPAFSGRILPLRRTTSTVSEVENPSSNGTSRNPRAFPGHVVKISHPFSVHSQHLSRYRSLSAVVIAVVIARRSLIQIPKGTDYGEGKDAELNKVSSAPP